jgi:hypothetical protein
VYICIYCILFIFRLHVYYNDFGAFGSEVYICICRHNTTRMTYGPCSVCRVVRLCVHCLPGRANLCLNNHHRSLFSTQTFRACQTFALYASRQSSHIYHTPPKTASAIILTESSTKLFTLPTLIPVPQSETTRRKGLRSQQVYKPNKIGSNPLKMRVRVS